ncbi:MAG: tetratricopeptide repeat protein, partial [Christensenellales bacterium]
MKCIYCGSEDVIYRKFHHIWECQDCGESFDPDERERMTEEINVFFSYAHDDKNSENGAVVVDRLKQLIEEKSGGKIKIWLDTYSIPRNKDWRELITSGIVKSDRFVGFMSRKALRDPGVCRDELGIAVGSRYGIISCVLLEGERTLNPPAEFTERQWIDLSDWKKKRDEGEAEFERFLNDAADELIGILRDPETLRFNHEVKKLKESLGISAVDEMTRIDELLKFKMTGRGWLEDRINTWLNDKNGSRVMTLYADPGAGKSLFSAHFQFANPNVIAALACDSRSEEYSQTDKITDRLAYLIALRLPDYRRQLMHILTDKKTLTKTGHDRFNTLIATPLSRVIDGERSAKLIIIDGLDEAKSGALAEFIRSYHDKLKPYIRILITARPERMLRRQLAPSAEFSCTELNLDDYAEMNDADIRQYYEENLEDLLKDRPGRDVFMDRLVEASSGIFCYAFTILPQLRESLEKGEPLEGMTFPKGLNALLLKTFLRKFGEPDASGSVEKYNEFVREPLSMVAASPYALPLKTLQKMQGWTNARLEDFLRPLETMLDLSGGFIRLFHKSFTDWLNDSEASAAFYAPQADGIRSLAAACFKAFEQGADEMDTYELANASRLLRSAGMKKEYEQLTDSSEYTSALKKLAKAYADDRQHERAAELYLEYARIFKEKCENSGDPDQAHEAVWGNIYACDALVDMLDYTAAEVAANAALRIAEKFAKKYPDDPQMQRDLSVSYERLGNIAKARSDYNAAEGYYAKALEIREKLAEKYPEDPNLQRDLSVSYERLGGIAEALNDYKAAEGYYAKTLEIREKLAEKYPDDPGMQRDLSVSYNKLGGIAETRNDYKAAEGYYAKALEIGERLAEKYPEDPNLQRDLSISYNNLGDIAKARNDYKAAEGYYAKELEISEKLAEKYPDDPQMQRDLSFSYNKLGGIAKALKDFNAAEGYYAKALAISERLAEKYPDDPRLRHDLSVSYSDLGNIAEARNDYRAAEGYYAKTLEIFEKLAEKYPDDPHLQRDLSTSYEELGDIAKARNDYRAAEWYYAKALTIREKLAEKYPDDPKMQRDCSVSNGELGDIATARNEYRMAEGYYAKALEICERLAEKYPDDPKIQCNLSVSYSSLGNIAEARNNYRAAERYYAKALEICERLAEKYPDDPKMQRDLYVQYGNLGNIAKARNDYKAAEGYYAKDLEISEKLAEKYPDDPNLQSDLSVSYNKLGDIAKALKDYNAAEGYYAKALEIRKRLAEKYPDDPNLQRNLSVSYNKLGYVAEARNDYKAAEAYCSKTLEIFEKLAEKYPDDPGMQRDLCVSYNNLGGIVKARNDYRAAERHYAKALEIWERLAEKYPDDPNLQRGLCASYNNLGDIAEALNDYKAAEGYYAKALEICERLAEKYPDDPGMQRDLSISYNNLGDIAKALNDYKAAEGYYAKTLEIFEKLAEKYPDDPNLQRDLSISYERLGDIAEAL